MSRPRDGVPALAPTQGGHIVETGPSGFVSTGHADVTVLIVTYNSAADLTRLLSDLRHEADDLRLRVVVADNSSTDTSLEEARRHTDVIAVATGGNRGYAGGLNEAMRHAGDTETILILNPDLRLERGAINVMLNRMRREPATGAVVPLFREPDGSISYSLRREPTLRRAAADALLGRVWSTRSLSEHIRDPRAYEVAHTVEWATGAALLVRTAAAAQVGEWDERFFLYSEETDFQRRLREAGWQVRFDPAAIVTHRGGGSGVSDELVALTIVNRIRYMDKHAPVIAGLFRAVVIAGEQLRRDATHGMARWALRRRSRWAQLPHAQASDATVDHVLVTRFNLPTPGPESLVRAREGWLRDRVELFERYTVPSVAYQSVQSFRWIVYLDPQSPQWLLSRLQPHIDAGRFVPLFRETVLWPDVARDARTVTGACGELLLTTNLDNDDAIADDFVARLQKMAREHRHAALYLGEGLIAAGPELYLRRDPANAFCSVVESWDDPLTAWRDCHTDLSTHFPAMVDAGAPAWLQVVHGGNVSNRVRGRRVSPAAHQGLFGDLLDDLPVPSRTTITADRWLRSPVRGAKEAVRAAGKRIILRLVGRDGLERLKHRLAGV